MVAGKVILGEEIQLQRCPGGGREPRLLDGPGFPAEEGEVSSLAPRNVFVRHPVLGRGQVAVEVFLDCGLKFEKQRLSRVRTDGLPTSMSPQAVLSLCPCRGGAQPWMLT